MATARSSQTLRLFPPKLTDREEGIGAGGVLGLIAALREPSLLGIQVLDPKTPLAALPAEHDHVEPVDDHVGVPALGELPYEIG
jgi:hypothetical protein